MEDTPENKAAVNQVLSQYQEQFSGAGVLQVANKDEFKVAFGPAEDLIDNDATPELIQADLYFGRNISDGGEVSESEFQTFVDNVVAPRFGGLTQFDAQGQVRDSDDNILKESSKVVTLFIEDTQTNETAINEVLELYQQQFPGAGVAQTVNEDVAIAFGVANDIIDNDATPETIQADLYFGRNIPDGGQVSEAGFQAFLDNVVAPRFFGLTQFDAQGQVSNDDGSILREPSKVVTLILEDTVGNESAIQDVLTAYQQLFNGAGVAQVIDEDIKVNFAPLPTLAISAEPTFVNEGEQLKFNFDLSEAAPSGGLTVNLDLVEDTDPLPGDITYFVDGSENITDFDLIVNEDTGLIDGATVSIASGATSATLLSDIIADNATEGPESVKFGLANGDCSIDSEDNAASFTIVDTSTDLPTLSLSAQPNQVNEGEQLKFNFDLSEAAPSGGLTVNLDLVEDTDPLPGDITYFVDGSDNITDFKLLVNDDTGLIDGATVSIASGATSATLLSDIIADNATEGPESVKFGLANGNYSIDGEDNAASFTIVDTSTDLPTLSLSAQPSEVNEGEQLKFNFDLSEAAPTGGLTVNLDLVEDTDPLPGDINYFVDGSDNITDFELLVNEESGLIDGATVTIAEGSTSATLLSDIIADNATEGPESVKFGLAGGDYSIDGEDNAASFTIVDTSVANEISGTTGDDNLYGTNDSEIISGGRGDDNISGNGGMDTLIGGRGDDDIYGGFEADEISGGRGDDYIFGNGGDDLINSGSGFDTVYLGKGEATVILDKGEGFDTIFNFQLGATKFEVGSLDNLNFADSMNGAEIFLQGDLLAVVAGQSANTFSNNQDSIFTV